MGSMVHGWIERRWPYTASLDGRWSPWFAAVDVAAVLCGDRNYDLWGYLFGFHGDFVPALPNRGLPSDLSHRARADLAEISNGELDLPGLMAGHYDLRSSTWALGSEIERLDWDAELVWPANRYPLDVRERDRHVRVSEELTPRWRLVFDLVRLLAEEHGADSVRLVVWFTS